MSDMRDKLLSLIEDERERNFNLPGSEWDSKNTPNDWIAIAGSYLLRASTRKTIKPRAEDFEDDLVKSAAIILAALEHIKTMKDNGSLI